jgi:hypothetical protein
MDQMPQLVRQDRLKIGSRTKALDPGRDADSRAAGRERSRPARRSRPLNQGHARSRNARENTLYSTLAFIRPVEYEQHWYASQDQPPPLGQRRALEVDERWHLVCAVCGFKPIARRSEITTWRQTQSPPNPGPSTRRAKYRFLAG